MLPALNLDFPRWAVRRLAPPGSKGVHHPVSHWLALHIAGRASSAGCPLQSVHVESLGTAEFGQCGSVL